MIQIVQGHDRIRAFFQKVVRENNLDGMLIFDFEGLPLVSYTSAEADEEVISASSAAMVSAGMIAGGDAGKTGLKQIIIDTEDGYIVLVPVGNEYIVGLFAPPGTKLGIVRVIVRDVERFLKDEIL
jgi:predicted regulator of Ras-like GTPase activity (Roadblock/LC7/MglB family)